MRIHDAISVVDYKRKDGSVPFAKWFQSLGIQAKAKVDLAIARLRSGNFSNVKMLGRGVSEYKVNFGPGYRVYFGKEGERVVILLGGGTKKKQNGDIENAKKMWKEYKARKKEGDLRWH